MRETGDKIIALQHHVVCNPYTHTEIVILYSYSSHARIKICRINNCLFLHSIYNEKKNLSRETVFYFSFSGNIYKDLSD